jgi:hypothetical protein
VVCVIKRERERERERENVSGALLENAFERELKMKDTSQIGKIAYEFLSLSFSFPSFSVC